MKIFRSLFTGSFFFIWSTFQVPFYRSTLHICHSTDYIAIATGNFGCYSCKSQLPPLKLLHHETFVSFRKSIVVIPHGISRTRIPIEHQNVFYLFFSFFFRLGIRENFTEAPSNWLSNLSVYTETSNWLSLFTDYHRHGARTRRNSIYSMIRRRVEIMSIFQFFHHLSALG